NNHSKKKSLQKHLSSNKIIANPASVTEPIDYSLLDETDKKLLQETNLTIEKISTTLTSLKEIVLTQGQELDSHNEALFKLKKNIKKADITMTSQVSAMRHI